MSEEYPRIPISSGIKATEAIGQYLWVKNDGGDLVVTAASTDIPLGPTKTSIRAGQAGPVIKFGRWDSIVDANATPIAVDDDLMPGTGGKLVKHVDGAGNVIVAKALEAADKDGQQIEVFVLERRLIPTPVV